MLILGIDPLFFDGYFESNLNSVSAGNADFLSTLFQRLFSVEYESNLYDNFLLTRHPSRYKMYFDGLRLLERKSL